MMSTVGTTDDTIKLWLKVGNIEKLEQAVLNGYGDQLRGKTSRIPKINQFLKRVPHFQAKIDAIHEAVAQGKLRDVQGLMDRKKLAMCRNQNGASPLHTAVLYKQMQIIKYILDKFPSSIQARDNQGRTPLHYASIVDDGGEIYKMLLEAGADKKAADTRGKIPEYYLQNPEEMPLKQLREGAPANRIIARHERTMQKDVSTMTPLTKLEVKQLIQRGDVSKLEQVVLNGNGDKLLGETAVNGRVKEFLEMVPEFLKKQALLHAAVVEGSLRDVKSLLDRRTMATSRDPYGATALHKAVIHNYHQIVKYLVENFPETINLKDQMGRTPLHYAAVVEDERIYKTLVGAGADENIQDNAGKTPTYYKESVDQIDLTKIQERNRELASHANEHPSEYLGQSHNNNAKLRRDGYQNMPLNSHTIRLLVRGGEVDKLEQIVLEGHGLRLVGETATDSRTRMFLKQVPAYMAKIEALHEAVAQGNLREVRVLLDRKRLACSKDQSSLGLLHKSLLYSHPSITRYICQKFPEALSVKDSEGRSPLHFAAVIRDDGYTYHLLREAGADPLAADSRGNPPVYYREHPEELDLLDIQNRLNRLRSKLQAKKSTTGRLLNESTDRGFHVTRANIRKWIHAEDIDKLQQVVLEGQGDKLLVETSTNPRVREFLKTVPAFIAQIRDVHQAVQDGSIKELQEKADQKQLYMSKDTAGLTPLHKAVLLGNEEMTKFIIDTCPDSIKVKDEEGRLPLHYAGALTKDNGNLYKMLLAAGSDSKAVDERGRTAEYYFQHRSDTDVKMMLMRIHKRHLEVHTNNANNQPKRQVPPTLRIAKKVAQPVGMLSPEQIAKIINQGDMEKLEQLVLDGHGKKLYGKTSWIEDVRAFLKRVPQFMDRIYAVHTAVANGDLKALEELMDNKKLVIARDSKGLTALHRAVKYGRGDIVKFMLQMYPAACNVRDNEGRTPLHYAGMYKDREDIYKTLLNFGADPKILDQKGKSADYYEKGGVKLEVRSPPCSVPQSGDSNKENATENENDNNESQVEEEQQIKQWIDDGNLASLEQLIIEGKGDLLLGKTSYKEHVQDFLEAVPAYMGKIRALHNAAADGDLRDLHTLLDQKSFAVAKDHLGACPLHRAILNGHTDVVRFLAYNYPATLNIQDNEGRTPLHYAAVASDDGLYYRLLHNYGADTTIKDNAGHTAGQYLRGQGELTIELLQKRYEEKKVPPRPPSVQTWERPPTEEILKALTPSPPPGPEEPPVVAAMADDEGGEVTLDPGDEPEANEGENENEGSDMDTKDGDADDEASFGDDKEDNEAEEEPKAEEEEEEKKDEEEKNDEEPGEDEAEVPKEEEGENKENEDENENKENEVAETQEENPEEAKAEDEEQQADEQPEEEATTEDAQPEETNENAEGNEETNETVEESKEEAEEETKEEAEEKNETGEENNEEAEANNEEDATPNVEEEPKEDETPNTEAEEEPKDEEGNEAMEAQPVVADEENDTQVISEDEDKNEDKSNQSSNNSTAHSSSNHSRSSTRSGNPIMWTKEGEYLASVMGDALIKALTEVSQRRPPDPITYLALWLYKYDFKSTSRKSTPNLESVDENDPLINSSGIDKEEMEKGLYEARLAKLSGRRLSQEAGRTLDLDDILKLKNDDGQTILHYGAGKPHEKNAFFQLLLQGNCNVADRDGTYQTPRDIAEKGGLKDNVDSIDKYICWLATKGRLKRLQDLVLNGYDSLLDVTNEQGSSVTDLAELNGHMHVVEFLKGLPEFKEKRDNLHTAIRDGALNTVTELIDDKLAIAKDTKCRCSLHVAVLNCKEDITDYIANTYPKTIRILDNMGRAPLHYAMGLEESQNVAKVLIQAGASRLSRDAKQHTPSYYFINREEILQLKAEENEVEA